jgi:hypothetical protein
MIFSTDLNDELIDMSVAALQPYLSKRMKIKSKLVHILEILPDGEKGLFQAVTIEELLLIVYSEKDSKLPKDPSIDPLKDSLKDPFKSDKKPEPIKKIRLVNYSIIFGDNYNAICIAFMIGLLF